MSIFERIVTLLKGSAEGSVCARCGTQVRAEFVYYVPTWLGVLGKPLMNLGLVGFGLGLVLWLVLWIGWPSDFGMFFCGFYSGAIGVASGVLLAPIGLLISQERSRSYRCPACGHVGFKARRARLNSPGA